MPQDPILLGGVIFLAVLIIMAIGVPIGAALGFVAICGFYLIQGNEGLAGFVPFRTMNSFILTAIPMFIFLGEVMLRSGATDGIYRSAGRLVNRAPGGLLHSNIISCALFSAISGSSPATAATIGVAAVPALKSRGYDRGLTLGSLAAGGALGNLIPPGITFLVYGALAETSIAKLFAGGMIPGIIVAALWMVYIAARATRNPALAPREASVSVVAAIVGLRELWPLALLLTLIIGGIFSGVFTVTEAAAVSAVVTLGIATWLVRGIPWKIVAESIQATVRTTSMIMIIVVGAGLFSSLLATMQVPRALSNAVVDADLHPLMLLGLVLLLYFLLGMFIDGVSAMVMTLPTIIPLIDLAGIDRVWFGVFLTMQIEVDMLLPPYGINLFVIQGIARTTLQAVFLGTVPFIIIYLLVMVLVIIFPDIILWLPSTIE